MPPRKYKCQLNCFLLISAIDFITLYLRAREIKFMGRSSISCIRKTFLISENIKFRIRMLTSIKITSIVCSILILFSSCNGNKNVEKVDNSIVTNSLKKAYADDFYLGAAVNRDLIQQRGTVSLSLVLSEYNSISPENDLKWALIHPKKDSFYFEVADNYVALGEKNNLFTLGHTLVWHSQLADYMKNITDSTAMALEVEKHINTIVARYKGKINAWDVVNEALNEDGTLRESVFLKVLGEDYIGMVFSLAAKADPNAKLIYNDYNLTNSEKRAGVVHMVKKLQGKGIKIDGVGMQGHWNLNGPSLEEIENSIIAYAALGLKVSISELDITVIPNPWDLQGADIDQNFEGSAFMNPYPEQLPDSVQILLAKRYQDIFSIFIKHKDKMERITFWGVNDASSWLNNWPIKERTNYPLLFDRNFKPKAAYDSIIALKGLPTN